MGAVNPRGKFGLRRGRRHQGVDLPLKMRDTIYATFSGRVRISQSVRGYGNLIIIRHDNGLETYYGHLSERLVGAEPVGRGGGTSSVWAAPRDARRVPTCTSRPVTTDSRSTPSG